MNLIIRKNGYKDNKSLALMIRKVFEEHNAPRLGTVYSDPKTDDLYSLFEAARSVLWIALIDDLPVGCCGIYPTPGLKENYAELVKFYLDKNYRNNGIGKELMLRSIQSAKEFGYTHLYLESLPHFSKALGMYKKTGFKNLDAPLADSGHNSCNIWMVKEL